MFLLITTILFSSQLIHLYWLTTDVVAARLLGESLFNPTRVWEMLLISVDYVEIPALLAASLLYMQDIRKKGVHFKALLFLVLINSQWLHIFWITDELVVGGQLPLWLSWTAIALDYLELPVIIDTNLKTFHLIKQKLT